MRIATLLVMLSLAACGPAPLEQTPSEPQLAPAPALGAAELAERERADDALAAASREARGPVDPAAQSVPAPPAPISNDRIVTLALTELAPNEARAPRNGGSAAIVLADPASALGAAKNLALCRALFQSFDDTGSRVARASTPRPIYWLSRSAVLASEPNQERCATRVLAYDYPRSERLALKLGLSGPGPFLVAERHDLFEDERVAAVIDLARTRPEQIDEAVRYFRDRLLPSDDLWSPDRFAAPGAREDMARFLNSTESDIPFTPRLVRAARDAGCPLTDLLDVCAGPD